MTTDPRTPKEHEIVSAILPLLDQHYPEWLWVRVEPSAAVRMTLKRAGQMRGGQWMDAPWSLGVSDIIGLGCPPVCLEVKRRKNNPSHSQLMFQDRCERHGGVWYRVVHTPEEALAVMKIIQAQKKKT